MTNMQSLPQPRAASKTAPIGHEGGGTWIAVRAGDVWPGDVVELSGGPLWGHVFRLRHVGGRVVIELACRVLAARRVLDLQLGECLRVYRCREISQPHNHAPISGDTL